jgi:hypothetical protein
MLLLLGGLLLVATGCQVPLTDSGQYLACTPDLECREGYECRLVDEQYACVPSDSNVGTELDAGGMDTEDTTTDVSDDGSTEDVTDEDTNQGDASPCSQDCDAQGLVCDDSTGKCVACLVDRDCGDGVCFESPNGAADNACVECRSDEQCGSESFCDLGQAQCVPKDAKWFLERLAEEYRRTACEATFSDQCAPTLTTFFVANRAPSKSECLEYGVDYFTEQSELYVEMLGAAKSGEYEASWFDLDAAGQCLAEIADQLGEATCTSTFDNLPEACKLAIRGTEDSGPCFNQFMCPEGGYCDFATDSVCGGTCSPAEFPEEGQACSVDDPCDPTKDLVCVRREDDATRCFEKYSQDTDGTCAGASEGQAGQACRPGLDCQPVNDFGDAECKPYVLVGQNESCSSDSELCEPGLYCAGGAGASICVPIPTSDDVCDDMIECALGSYCNGTKCVPELGLNENCSGGGLCEPGLVCSSSGRCVQQDELDPPC